MNVFHFVRSGWILPVLFTLVLLVAPQTGGRAYANPDTLIDHFTSSQTVTVSGAGTNPVTASGQLDDTNILGGERDILVTRTGGSGIVEAYSNVATSSYLTHGQGAGTLGSTLLTYDGNDSSNSLNPTGLNGKDLTNGGTDDRFQVLVPTSDQGAVLKITVWTNASSCSSQTITISTAVTNPTTLNFVYTGFTTGTGCTSAATFSNAGAIQLLIDGRSTTALDMTIDLITTAGAPTSAVLLSGGVQWNASKRSVIVRWQTGTELNVIGFNVWRRVGQGKWRKLNAMPIDAENPGGISGARYSYRDDGAKPGKKHWYKVELLSPDGTLELSRVMKILVPQGQP